MVNIYNIIFFSGYFISFFENIKNSKNLINIFFISLIILLIVLSGFRSINVGYDNTDHKLFFERITKGDQSILGFKDPGYAFLSYIIGIFGDYNLFLIFYSLISFYFLVKSIKFFSIKPFLSLYIYYSFYFLGNNMAKIRQSLAVLILLFSLIFLYKKKYTKFYLLTFLATTFHASSIVFFILPFLEKIKLNKRRMFLLIIISIIIGSSGLIEYLYFQFFSKSAFLINLDFLGLNRFVTYSSSSYVTGEGGLAGYLYVLLLTIILIYKHKSITDKYKNKGNIITLTYFWGAIIFFIFFGLRMINSRITMGFRLTEIFLLPYIFTTIKHKYFKYIFIIVFLFLVLLRGYLNFQDYYDKFVPFTFFWQI